MYSVHERPDGRWTCRVRIRDGTEQWTEPTLANAVVAACAVAGDGDGMMIAVEMLKVCWFDGSVSVFPWRCRSPDAAGSGLAS